MWHYSDAQRFRHSTIAAPPIAQSTYDLLLGMRGMAVAVLLPDRTMPQQAPICMPGFLEEISASTVWVGLAAPLPELEPGISIGVEIPVGSGVLRFEGMPSRRMAEGDVRLELALPGQIGSVQRRKHSRTGVSAAVVFARQQGRLAGEAESGGIGHTVDMSAGGLRFITPALVQTGEHLYISFSLPNGTAFRGLSARVARVKADAFRYTVALQFTGLNPALEHDLVQAILRFRHGQQR